jgi:starch synthase (maltosyl-transferring)
VEKKPMVLYNLFPLLAGHFDAWQPHFERAADLGCDWVFVNPIQQPGASSSLYSIADYFQLNSALVDADSATSPEDQLRQALSAAREKGLKVMVDLVINHCAADSHLITEHPTWFARNPDASLVHPSCQENGETVVWQDLVRFDHQQTTDPEGLFHYCQEIVNYLVGLGFSGFRCDAAYQIPTSVWQRLIEDTKSKDPDIVFAAETLGCTPDQTRETAVAGFDYIFNSSKWWDFESDWLLEQYQQTRTVASSISFPESHDTARLMEEADGNVNVLKQRYLFAALFSTSVMFPVGYEFGFRRPLHVVDSRPEHWEQTTVDLQDYIKRVNNLKTNQPLFCEETVNTLIPSPNSEVLVLHKVSTQSGQEALVILNKDPHNRQPFRSSDLNGVVKGKPIRNVSPEYSSLAVRRPQPFSHDLDPGQGLVWLIN